MDEKSTAGPWEELHTTGGNARSHAKNPYTKHGNLEENTTDMSKVTETVVGTLDQPTNGLDGVDNLKSGLAMKKWYTKYLMQQSNSA